MVKITDEFIEKDGKKIKRFHLLYIDGDKKPCDCCDEEKICASVEDIIGNVWIICKDCLQDIIKEFN